MEIVLPAQGTGVDRGLVRVFQEGIDWLERKALLGTELYVQDQEAFWADVFDW